MEIEVCVSSIEDVVTAEKAGATRIELCTAMEVLGVTPTISNYIKAKEISNLPILAYIRPRAGGFVYSDLEFEIMKMDARLFNEHGSRQFVIGILTEAHQIDQTRTRELMDVVGQDCKFVIHKAFDYVRDFDEAAQACIAVGFHRILTAGGPKGTLDQLDVLKHLISTYGDAIEIMPGGGIVASNIEEVLDTLPLTSVHLSAKMMKEDTFDYVITDFEHLQQVVTIVNDHQKQR